MNADRILAALSVSSNTERCEVEGFTAPNRHHSVLGPAGEDLVAYARQRLAPQRPTLEVVE